MVMGHQLLINGEHEREKTRTIYYDESGDLSGYYKESPVYCLSLVLLSSEDDATPYLREFHRRYHSKNGGESHFHAGPIIRGEECAAFKSYEQWMAGWLA